MLQALQMLSFMVISSTGEKGATIFINSGLRLHETWQGAIFLAVWPSAEHILDRITWFEVPMRQFDLTG